MKGGKNGRHNYTGREKGTFSYGQSLNMITHFWGNYYFLFFLIQDHDTSWRAFLQKKIKWIAVADLFGFVAPTSFLFLTHRIFT